MKAAGFLETGNGAEKPDFAAMAEAVGGRGFRLERPEEVEAAGARP